MSLDQDLVRLVKEVVKAELNSSRTNATEVVGRGGDTVLSSMGNIFIQPGTNKKAYYHETEIGSGSGSDISVKVSANDTTAGYLNGKLVSGTGITLTENSDGGNETLSIAVTGGSYGDVFTNVDNIFTADHQTIRGAGGSSANSPTLLFRNSTWSAVDYNVLQLTDEGYLDIGTGDSALPRIQGDLRCVGAVRPTVTDNYDLGSTALTLWWRNVYAQKYYVDNVSTYISLVGTDMKFFDANNAAGKTLTELVAGGVHSSLSNLDYASAGHTGFFPLVAGSGNRLTGDLYIKKTVPSILLEDDTPTTQLQIAYAVGTGSYINSPNADFLLAKGGSTKLTVGTSAITVAVDVVLGTNKLRGTAGGGSDVILGDDLSGLKAASTYADIKSIGTITPGSTGTKDLGSSSLFWNELFAQIHYVEATTLKIDKNGSNMRFTIPAGGVYEFVVSA